MRGFKLKRGVRRAAPPSLAPRIASTKRRVPLDPRPPAELNERLKTDDPPDAQKLQDMGRRVDKFDNPLTAIASVLPP